ncbi:hypothetical protein D3C80_1778090 [compost metagenome]
MAIHGVYASKRDIDSRIRIFTYQIYKSQLIYYRIVGVYSGDSNRRYCSKL